MMKRLAFIILMTLLTLTSCSLLGGGDEENLPDIPGKIVFSAKDDDGTSQIYTMDANGSDVKQLTHFPPEGGGTSPAWSPNGRRIVFSNYTGASTLGPYLYLMDADGGNMRPLKRMPDSETTGISALIGTAPAWSPDGSKIAFQVCLNCELFGSNYEISYVEVAGKIYDPDHHHAVTDSPYSDTHPTWSPDGQRIAFASDRDYVNADTMRYRTDLYVITIDGTNLKRLSKLGNVSTPRWDSSGDYIAYAWQRIDPDIYLLNLKTTNIQKLTDLKFVGAPMWNNKSNKLLIPGTTKEGKSVNQLISRKGTLLKELELGFKNLKDSKNYDWFIPTKN